MSEDDGRPLIDERGRVFGVVNIIDAFVVFFVAVLVIGGVWFVAISGPDTEPAGEGPSQNETQPTQTTDVRYATVDLGTVSPPVAEQLARNDTVRTGENTNLTITDMYRADAGDNVRVFARVELEGTATETDAGERFTYGGGPLRLGRELTFRTDQYATVGRIQSVATERPNLERTEVETVLDVQLSAATLREVSVGDEYRAGGDTIGTIASIEAYGTGQPDVRRAQIGVRYTVVAPLADTQPELGTTAIREGATVPFETERYELTGEVHRVGATDPRGEVTTRTVTLERAGLTETRAAQFQAGMTEQVADHTVAEITDTTVTPETVAVTTADGELIERDSPTNRTLMLTVRLRVRETPDGPRFKTEPLRINDRVTLEFEETTLDATVTDR